MFNNEIFARVLQNHFFRSVGTLATGTLVAQIVVLATSPILTRLYSPEEFGIYALFLAIVSSLSPAVCGKYEVAIVLPRNDRHGIEVLGVAVIFSIAFTSVFLVVLFVFNEWILQKLDSSTLRGWIYLAPLVLMLTAVSMVLNLYANRHQQYRLISRVKIYQSVIVVTVSIAAGLLGVGFPGLLFAPIVGLMFINIYLLHFYRTQINWSVLQLNRRKAMFFKRYKDFPIFSASPSILNGITLAMPIFFLSKYYPDSVVGLYALVLRVVNAPLTFVASSVAQVNLKEIVDLVNRKQKVRPYLIKLTGILVLFSLPPTLLLMVYSQELFVFVFGNDWVRAGLFAQIMAPSLAVRFVVSPLSSTLGATQNNKVGMIWKISAFILTIMLFMWAGPKGDIIYLLKAFVILDILLYVYYYALIWRAAGHPMNAL